MEVDGENMENMFAVFWIEKRILHIRYKPEVFVDLGAARIIVSDRIQFQNGKSFPVLCYADGISNSTKPARDYLAVKSCILVKAIAYVAGPTVSRAILQFFIEKNKPAVPSAVFTTEMAAREFLLPFVGRHL